MPSLAYQLVFYGFALRSRFLRRRAVYSLIVYVSLTTGLGSELSSRTDLPARL